MNYVDHIIRYLSDELSPDEANSFKKELASNDELQKEYVKVSAAFDLIRDQLQKRDELAFREKLLEVMEQKPPFSTSSPQRIRPWWYISLALAGTLAILLAIFLNPMGKDRILSRYYAPDQDPVLLSFHQDTRGEQERGILNYREGSYAEAMKILEPHLSQEPDNRVLLLYYLLSALELDRESEAINRVMALTLEKSSLPDQAIGWYCTLALIKSNRAEEALMMLEPLTKESGPYRPHAESLHKLLLK